MKTRVTEMVAGTRGGLGRILLTAFMLLAIVPLSVVSYLAVRRSGQDIRQTVLDRLELVTASSAVQVQTWLDAQQTSFFLFVHSPSIQQLVQDGDWNGTCKSALMNARSLGIEMVALTISFEGGQVASCAWGEEGDSLQHSPAYSVAVSTEASSSAKTATVTAFLDLDKLEVPLSSLGLYEGERIYLLDQEGQLLWSLASPDLRQASGRLQSNAVEAVLQGQEGSGFYENAFGESVVGAYRWLPRWKLGLLIEQPKEVTERREDDLATLLIGSTLAVALLTTMLAAVVTRRLTRPIVQLTMSAVKVADGDLDQVVQVTRRDEIGILAQAFNVMTAELRSLYEGLEQKVIQRTRQLMEANRQLRYQTMQLTLVAEIGRVATSILDLDELLDRVLQLILDSYSNVYGVRYVGVFLQDEFGEWLELQASKGGDAFYQTGQVAVGGETLVGRVAVSRKSVSQSLGAGEGIEVAIPLRIGARIIGVLDLRCLNGITQQDIQAWESLSDQMSVAIENARAYEAEHEAVERLSRLDHVRLASLSAGSRELATALNNIIGFSGLILKGVDGSLTDLQRADLVVIHKSGYQLLGLIDNVITLSEIESGTMALDFQKVDLVKLVDDALATARQRFVDLALVWQGGHPVGLPLVQGDPALLRKALLGVFSVAVEEVPEEKIAVRAWTYGGVPSYVIVCVGNCERQVWEKMLDEQPALAMAEDLGEMSINLALSKQIVALHKGQIWIEFDSAGGWGAALALPVHKVASENGL